MDKLTRLEKLLKEIKDLSGDNIDLDLELGIFFLSTAIKHFRNVSDIVDEEIFAPSIDEDIDYEYAEAGKVLLGEEE